MTNAKDSIPKTHTTEQTEHEFAQLICPRCKNDKRFTVLVQYRCLNGIIAWKEPPKYHPDLTAEWWDYNTIICDECSFYLIYGGPWKQVEDDTTPSRPRMSREDMLKSIPLDVLEEMLKEKEKGGM